MAFIEDTKPVGGFNVDTDVVGGINIPTLAILGGQILLSVDSVGVLSTTPTSGQVFDEWLMKSPDGVLWSVATDSDDIIDPQVSTANLGVRIPRIVSVTGEAFNMTIGNDGIIETVAV